MIVDEGSFKCFLDKGSLIFIGNGADKVKTVINHANAHFIEGVKPVASSMLALSEKAFRDNRFLDVAYSTPLYLKEFQATTPKKQFSS